MEISRILIVFFVLMMMMCKEVINQQIRPQNNLQERSKRYHESDHDSYLTRAKQVKIEREKKNVQTEPMNVNAGPQARGRLLNLNLESQVPAKTYIPTRKIVQIKPLHRNTKNIATHKPYVLNVHNHNLSSKKTDEKSKVNETLKNETSEVKVEEKEQVVGEVVDTKTVDETLSTGVEKGIHENPEKPLEELVSIKCEEPQITKPINSAINKSTKKEFKFRKLNDEESEVDKNIKTSDIKQESEKQLKIGKIIPPITKSGTLLCEKPDENKAIEKQDKTDEKVTVNVTVQKDSSEIITEDLVKPLKDDEIIPRKHPFLEANQNELHISCPINFQPKNDKVNEPRNDDKDEAIKKSPFDLSSIHTLPKKTENNDENEGVVIKNLNYEEFREVTRTPINDPASYNSNTAQDNITPETYANYYQVPCNNYQVPQTEIDLNNDYNPFAPSEQRTDQIDNRYNKNYKIPNTAYDNSNYNGYYTNCDTPNYNGNYGYVTAKPGQSVGNNAWNNNRGIVNQYQNNVNAKDRIWRSWKTTEYYLKTKNALKQLSNERFYNLVNQNNRADKIKYVKSNNAMDVNGYHRR